MKKMISILLILLLVGFLVIPAGAAPEEPVITMQPWEAIEETLGIMDENQTPLEKPDGISWWVILIVALGAAGIGVAVAFMLIKKK